MSARRSSGTIDEVLMRMHLTIEGVGWTFTAVQGGPYSADWTYTTGLTQFRHPELIITGARAATAAETLEHLCLEIQDGRRYASGDEEDVDRGVARFVEVHTEQHEATFANWFRYYSSLGSPVPELHALQVVVPDAWFAGSHTESQPLLDSPWVTLGPGADSRADRKAARRGRSSSPARPRRW